MTQGVVEVPLDTAAGVASSLNTAQEAGPSTQLIFLPFVLQLRDRVICDSIVFFLMSIRDNYVRTQAHSMIRAMLKIMVYCPTAAEYLQENKHTGPLLFVMILDMAANIRRFSESFRQKEYIGAVFKGIIDDISRHYAAGPIEIRLH